MQLGGVRARHVHESFLDLRKRNEIFLCGKFFVRKNETKKHPTIFVTKNETKNQPKIDDFRHKLLRGGGRLGPEDSKNIKTFAVAAKLKELE